MQCFQRPSVLRGIGNLGCRGHWSGSHRSCRSRWQLALFCLAQCFQRPRIFFGKRSRRHRSGRCNRSGGSGRHRNCRGRPGRSFFRLAQRFQCPCVLFGTGSGGNRRRGWSGSRNRSCRYRAGLGLFGLMQRFQGSRVFFGIGRRGRRDYRSGRGSGSNDFGGSLDSPASAHLGFLSLMQCLQCPRVLFGIGGRSYRGRGCRGGGSGATRGRLAFFGLMQRLKRFGLVVRVAGCGLGLGDRSESNTQTTHHDAKLSVNHIDYLSEMTREINSFCFPKSPRQIACSKRTARDRAAPSAASARKPPAGGL